MGSESLSLMIGTAQILVGSVLFGLGVAYAALIVWWLVATSLA